MVRLLKSTHYNGKSYSIGDEFDIDEITKKRWIENGIAESVYVERQPESPARRKRVDSASNEVD